MSSGIVFLKTMYKMGRVTMERLQGAKDNGAITEAELAFIIGEAD